MAYEKGSLAEILDEQRQNAEAEVERITADLAAMTAERDAFKARSEAAERDIRHAISMSPYAICGLFCKNHKPGCGGVNCRPEWRGLCSENAQEESKDADR